MTFGGSAPVPLVPGSLRGLRVWDLRGTGTLEGVVYPGPWGEGEQEAICKIGIPGTIGAHTLSKGQTLLLQKMLKELHPEHHVAAALCSCGFYAYYEGAMISHASPTRVLGIIEGYGRVTFGPLGFRCEKAKIVALYNPYYGDADSPNAVMAEPDSSPVAASKPDPGRIRRGARKAWSAVRYVFAIRRVETTAMLGYLLAILAGLFWPSLPLMIGQFLLVGIWWFCMFRRFRRDRKAGRAFRKLATNLDVLKRANRVMDLYRTVQSGENRFSIRAQAETMEAVGTSRELTPPEFLRLKKRYPNVPQFRSVQEMLLAFPPSNPEELKEL